MTACDLIREGKISKYLKTSFADISYYTVSPFLYRRSIIMITIVNPNLTVVDILKMMEGGMNVARMPPYTSNEESKQLIGKIDKAAKKLAEKYGISQWPCATCIELKSANVRTGLLQETQSVSIDLKKDAEVILTHNTAEFNKCNERRIFVDNPYLTVDIKLGMEISIGQDKIVLEAIEINEDTVKCVVTKEGPLRNFETVCMRGAKRTRPYITKKDLEAVKLAVENQVDMILVNYTRHPETITKIKKYIAKKHSKRPWITSGICTQEGLHNIDDIIKESDAILFPREKLAYEIESKYFCRMIRIQKYVTGKCREAGKPMILGGQVMQSMLDTGQLAHRDVTDVANAILEGVSGFALRACDDSDDLKVVMKRLTDICMELEPFTCNNDEFSRSLDGVNVPMNAAVTAAACCSLLANKSQARIIIVPTVSGRTIYYMNYCRPICLILAVTTSPLTFNQLKLYRSVVPLLYKGTPRHTWHLTITARLEFAVNYCLDKGWLGYGDDYVTLEKGFEESSFCDSVRIYTVTTKKAGLVCPEILPEPLAPKMSETTTIGDVDDAFAAEVHTPRAE